MSRWVRWGQLEGERQRELPGSLSHGRTSRGLWDPSPPQTVAHSCDHTSGARMAERERGGGAVTGREITPRIWDIAVTPSGPTVIFHKTITQKVFDTPHTLCNKDAKNFKHYSSWRSLPRTTSGAVFRASISDWACTGASCYSSPSICPPDIHLEWICTTGCETTTPRHQSRTGPCCIDTHSLFIHTHPTHPPLDFPDDSLHQSD